MKKLATLIAVAAIFAFPFAAEAKSPPYQITFESFTTPHAVSGATSIATGSGVTQLICVHKNAKRTSNQKYVDMATWEGMGTIAMIWLEDLDFSPAQINNAGTVDDTFDLYLEFYPKRGVESSVTKYVFKDESITSLQNNTAGPHFIKIPSFCYVRPWLVSGTTALGNARFGALVGLDDDDYEETLIPLSHATDDFATTGLTTFATSLGSVPAGCECIEIQFTSTDGGYSSPATSGVSKIIEENDVLPMPVKEYENGSFGPGAAAAGTINAQFWSRCPPK